MKKIWSHPKFKPLIFGGTATALLGIFGAPWLIIWLIFILMILSTHSEKSTPIVTPQIPAYLAPDVLENYIRSAPRATLLLDQNGRIVMINDALFELFPNVEVDQAFAQAFRTPALIDAVAQATSGHETAPLIYKSTRYLNKVFEARFSLLSAPFDEILNASTMIEFHDITKTAHNEAVRRDFIANASHELRTPLTTIQGGIETLTENKNDSQAADRFLPIMKSQADRMLRLIDDLMSLSKIEDQRPIDKDAQFDLAHIIKQTIAIYNTKNPKAVIKNIFGDGIQIVRGDEDQITQVLINLIENAIKHGGADEVQILRAPESAKKTGQIGVTIKDNGKGIDAKHIPRLSERFYRAGAAQKTGTGLGLAIVKHILIRHGGSLEVDSKIDKGSRFTFWINIK